MRPLFHFDTETFLISPGCQVPPMVCMQFAIDDGPVEIVHASDPALRGIVEHALEHTRMSGHASAFDMLVIAARWPDLLPAIFAAYADDRVVCTRVRDRLIDIAAGPIGAGTKYDLGSVALRRCGRVVDKLDPWRLRYGTLFGTPVRDWPAEALSYAREDVHAVRDVYSAQTALSYDAGGLVDEYRQSRATLWLRLLEARGVMTDPSAVERFVAQTDVELERDREVCREAGLVRHRGTKDTKAAMARCAAAYASLGEAAPLTDTGRVSLDADATETSGDEVLIAYSRYGSSTTIRSRAERLRRGTVTPLQSRYESLVATGRTSCAQGEVKAGVSPPAWGFQFQNLPREGDMRGCIVARPGYVLCSVDYDGIELRTVAQVQLWVLGESKLAEVLNEGRDAHTELGARILGIDHAEAYARRKGERGPEMQKDFEVRARQVAKPGNFGLWGGMGWRTFKATVRRQERIFLSDETAKLVRDAFYAEWDARKYFDWINALVGEGRGATIVQFASGRVRGGVGYTDGANTFFQGLAADAAKDAGFEVARECYTDQASALFGARPIIFPHDEFIVEVPEERAHEAAHRLAEVMCSVAQRWVPDVRITASPVLMRRWRKGAKAKYESGRLVPEDAQ